MRVQPVTNEPDNKFIGAASSDAVSSSIHSSFSDTSIGAVMAFNKENKSTAKRFIQFFCPAIHSLQNILILVFLLQTFICIGSLLLLIYSSGEKSINDIASIREENISDEIKNHMKQASNILRQIREGFLLQRRMDGDVLPLDLDGLTRRVMRVFAPTKIAFPQTTILYYGNSMKNYIAIEGSSSRNYVQIRNPQAEVVISSYNAYYEPVTESMRIPNYDPTIRPWYKAGLKAPFPNYQWSTVFNNFFIKCLSLGAATTLDYTNYNMTQLSNGTYTKQSVIEVIGAHFDLYQLDYVLNQTITDNLDIQTKSIDIVIIERTGYLISTSMGYETRDSNNNRVHMNQTTSVFSKISDYLMSKSIIIDPKGDISTLSTENSTIIVKIDQYRVSVQFIKDDHGLDWIIIQATVNYGFVKTVMTSDPALLSLSIIFIILGTILAMVVTQLITRSILKVSKDMSKISKLEVEEVKTSKLLKTVYELDLLQQSTKLVKNSLHSFMKYIPKDIVKDIVRNGIGAKLGVVNCSTSILFSDVADFTTFSESSTVSVLLKLLSEYFRIMTEAVEHNGGVIDKFIGDGVMALFSHPLKQLEDHHHKSCQAALDALVAIENLRIRCKKENWADLRIRVGVNSGNAMIGNVGSKERFNYTAIGDSVNTAGRLETLNKRYETTVLIGQSTYEQVKQKFLCLFVDVVKLKGKSKPTEVYTLEAEWSEATTIQKELHDSLIDIRDQLKGRQYENMIAKVDVLQSRISEWKTEAISLAASGDEGDHEQNDGPSFCFSNLKFVEDLKERASNLKQVADTTTGERSFMDITLALNEK